MIAAKDAANDLALVRTGLASSNVAALRGGVRLGESVSAFGYPLAGVLSTSGNFTTGNVTALAGLRDDSRYLQISVPIQPGNSGGPLVDSSGNIVGIVSAKLKALAVMVATEGDIPQNVNFAIKADAALTFLQANGVSVSRGEVTQVIAPADLADKAKALSVVILCQ